MAVEVLRLGLDPKGVEQGARRADRAYRQAAGGAERAAAANERLAATARLVQRALIAVAAVLTTREVIEYADSWRLLEGRLRLVTDTSEELAAVQRELVSIAIGTRTSLEATATLYQRVARNADDLGRSQAEILRFTDLVQKSIITSGATAQEASAGVIQLSQALASGRLAGEEFRQVSEQLPAILLMIRRATGLSAGELRQLANDQALSSQLVIDSLLEMGDTIDREFAQMPVTVGQAMENVNTLLSVLIGRTEEATGATDMFARSIRDFTADLLENEDRLSHWVNVLAFGVQVVITTVRTLINLLQILMNTAEAAFATLALQVVNLADLLPGVDLSGLSEGIRGHMAEAIDAIGRDTDQLIEAFMDSVDAFRAMVEGVNRFGDATADLDTAPAVREVAALVAEVEGLDAALRRVNLTLVQRRSPFLTERGLERQRERQIIRNEFLVRGGRLTPVAVPESPLADRLAEALENERVKDALNNLGDAIGSLSEKAARGVQGIRALASSVEALRAGPGSGLAGALSFAAAGIGTISAIGQLVSPIIGDLFGESQAERARREVMDRNTRALDELRLTLERFVLTLDRRAAAAEAAAAIASDPALIRALELSGGQTGTGVPIPNRDREILDQALRRFGFTIDEFVEIAERAGIELFDATGNLVIPALMQFVDAVGLGTEVLFGVFDPLDIERRRREIFDITDPGELFGRDVDMLRDLAPELFRAFGLDDIDLLTREGAQRFNEIVQQIFDEFLKDPVEFAKRFLGAFESGEQFLDWLVRAETAGDAYLESLDKQTKAIDESTRAVLNLPQGFRIASLEMARFNAMRLRTAEDLIDDATGGAGGAGGGSSIIHPPTAPPPIVPQPTAPPFLPPSTPPHKEPGGVGGGIGFGNPAFVVQEQNVTIEVFGQQGQSPQEIAQETIRLFRQVAIEDNLARGRTARDPWTPK